MGIINLDNKDTLSTLYETNNLELKFSSNNIEESVSLYTTGKNAITIYIRSQKEANTSHWCSVKAYKGGNNSKKSKEESATYLVSGIDHKISDISDIQLDPNCGNIGKKFDRSYGKIVRNFIMIYQKQIIDYWISDNINDMENIEKYIRETLKKNKLNLI